MHRSGLVVCCLLALCCRPAAAGGGGPGAGREETATADAPAAEGAVSRIATARRLIRYGLENSSPEALVVAVEMLLELRITRRELAKVERRREEGDDASAGETGGPAPAAAGDAYDPDEVLDEARRLAAGDPLANELIERVDRRREDRPRGHAGGAFIHCDRIRPNHVDRYQVQFTGGELAEVWVEGDGKSDLDCFVFNPGGSVVDSRTDHLDSCLLVWKPATTEGFALEIENLGASANAYCLVTN